MREIVDMGDILANIESAINDFEKENKRFPTKAFLGRDLLKKLVDAEELQRVSAKLTERLYKTFKLNKTYAQGIEFYEQEKFFRDKNIGKKGYLNTLKTIDKIKLLLILAAPRWSKKLKYIGSYEIGIPKTSHAQAY